MIFSVHPENPEKRKLNQLKDILLHDGVIIVPTDSMYALACDMTSQKAVDKICKLRGLNPVKANLTFMCSDIAQVSKYASQISNQSFRLMKRNTPGPFTFIIKSNNDIPKLFKNKKRTIGARIPDSTFLQDLISMMENPIMTATLKASDDEIQPSAFEDIVADWENRVDAVVECGTVPDQETGVIDLTGDDVEVLRESYVDLQM